MILLTGASGTVGRATARVLAGQGHAVRLLSRDPARLTVPDEARVEAVRGDFDDPDSLRAALTGVTAVLLVTSDPLREQDAALVTAAREAGVERLVKLSALAVTDPAADDLLTRWQRACEETVRGSGLAWTLLRPRAFMSNTLGWAAGIRRALTVRTRPLDAPSACVDPRDIAEVAALALTSPEHAGRAYPLTGPEPLTARDQARILGEVLGVPLECVELSTAERDAALARRYPAAMAEALVAMERRRATGGTGQVDPTVSGLLGRPAGTFAGWARDHAAHFAPPDAAGARDAREGVPEGADR